MDTCGILYNLIRPQFISYQSKLERLSLSLTTPLVRCLLARLEPTKVHPHTG